MSVVGDSIEGSIGSREGIGLSLLWQGLERVLQRLLISNIDTYAYEK